MPGDSDGDGNDRFSVAATRVCMCACMYVCIDLVSIVFDAGSSKLGWELSLV